MSDFYVIKGDASGEPKEVEVQIDPTLAGDTGDKVYTLKGKAIDTEDVGQEGVQIKAYHLGVPTIVDDVPVANNILLGEYTTLSEGDYIIYYTIPAGISAPILFIEAYDITDSENPVLLATSDEYDLGAISPPAIAPDIMTLDIVVIEGDYVGQTEFVKVTDLIFDRFDTESRDALPYINDTVINSVAREYSLESSTVKAFIMAMWHWKSMPIDYPDSSLISMESFYGFFRYGLSSSEWVIIQETPSTRKAALEWAISDNIISPSVESEIDSINASLLEILSLRALRDLDGDSYLAQMLNMIGVSDVIYQSGFYTAYETIGDDPMFWESVLDWQVVIDDTTDPDTTADVLTPSQRDDLKLVLQMGVIMQQHVPLIQHIYQVLAVRDIEDLAGYTLDDWLSYIGIDGTVPGIDGTASSEDQDIYAEALATATEASFPTEVLIKYMSVDLDYNNSDVHNWLTANPDFNIKTSSPRNYIATLSPSPDQTLTEKIYKIKRLWYLGQGYDKLNTIKKLEAISLLSATDITAVGRRNFIKLHASTLGGEAEAERIYKTAVKRTAAAEVLQANYNPAVNTVSTGVFKDVSVEDRNTSSGTENFPSLEVLFGSQDYCTCKNCRSSFSPAAYLVDLLTFLKQSEVNNIAGVTNAWELLQVRRPEFKYLELSCDNTNVTLPYIDIVNEVLEHAVDPPAEFAIPNDPTAAELVPFQRQTTLDSTILRVRPEYLRTGAYTILENNEYPWLLPFNLPNLEASLFLQQVKIDRGEMVRAIEGNLGFGSGVSLGEALVYLGISVNMQAILLSQTFEDSFGGKNSTSLKAIPVLLESSYLEYETLGELLESDFINPADLEITFEPAESCSIEDATLTDPSPTDNTVFTDFFKKLHRFERLRRLLGWTVPELDLALNLFVVSDIQNNVFTQLAGVKKLAKKLGLSVLDVLSFYTSLSKKSYQEADSEYDRVYLNPTYNTDSGVRESFNSDTVDVSIEGHLSVITSALRLSLSDLSLLFDEIGVTSNIAQNQLSYIYGASVFIHALSISVQDYLDLKAMIPASVPVDVSGASSPDKTLEFLAHYDRVVQSGFSIDDLNYLLRNEFEIGNYASSADEALAVTLTSIRSAIQQKLTDKNVSVAKSLEDLLNFFLIFMNEELAVQSKEIVEDGTLEDADTFIETHWEPYVTSVEDVKKTLVYGGVDYEADATTRISYVFSVFHDALIEELALEDLVIQTLSDDLDYPQEVVIQLINRDKSPSNNAQVMALFVGESFVFGSLAITNTSFSEHFQFLLATQKIALVIDQIQISSERIPFVLANSTIAGWYDMTRFTNESPEIDNTTFDQFAGLLRAFDLEKKYADVSNDFSIVDLIEKGINEEAVASIQSELARGTLWSEDDIAFLGGSLGFNFQTEDYKNEKWLVKLESVLNYVSKLGTSASKLDDYKSQDLTNAQADSIRSAVRSNYSDTSWLEIGAAIRDKLRDKQRDALSAYLIGHSDDPVFSDTDDLYSYFLLDTEMAPCSMTSRIKLAISTVQLWVQRIRMDLESNVKFGDEEMDEWSWRKNYRVWEAARKVFVYPENWLEPELRDDKSPFFQDLEDELLQDEVTSETAEQAYLNYLTKLDDVANLEMSGIYKEDDRNILHVFARTKNDPHVYYYRRQEDGFRWTAWERVDLDIEGDHLIPVTFNRRPMIFWPIFGTVPVSVTNESLASSTTGTLPTLLIEIKMAYSEWKNNKWQPKKLAKTKIITDAGGGAENYFFKVAVSEEGLSVDAYYSDRENIAFVGGFGLNNCNGQLLSKDVQNTALPAVLSVNSTTRNNMKLLEDASNTEFSITEELVKIDISEVEIDTEIPTNNQTILGATPNTFRITYPVTGVDLLSKVPFFYEDNARIFFVQPSEETFQKEFMVNIPVRLSGVKAAHLARLAKNSGGIPSVSEEGSIIGDLRETEA